MPLDAQVRDRIAVVASQTALMAQAYGEWSEADWQRGTFCAGWTAADAVAHLVTGADFYTQVIESGRTGTPGKPWGITNVEEFRVARGDAGKKLTAAGPAAVLQAFSRQRRVALQAVLESLQEQELRGVSLASARAGANRRLDRHAAHRTGYPRLGHPPAA